MSFPELHSTTLLQMIYFYQLTLHSIVYETNCFVVVYDSKLFKHFCGSTDVLYFIASDNFGSIIAKLQLKTSTASSELHLHSHLFNTLLIILHISSRLLAFKNIAVLTKNISLFPKLLVTLFINSLYSGHF